MTATPKGFRLHIGIFGRRNAGKSTLLNLIAGQSVSVVSDTPGTTTDTVEKAMEFIPLGPVVWLDTAGLDDVGGLGGLRAGAARKTLERVDMAVLVVGDMWGDFENSLYADFTARGVPVIVVINVKGISPRDAYTQMPDFNHVTLNAATGEGLEAFRQAVIAAAPAGLVEAPPILRDLVPPGSCVVLVTPIDKEAPKGRLILPQVQALRDALDGECRAVVCKENGLPAALADLKTPPALVVTDSQAFKEVAAVVPPGVPLTGFSVLYARAKGDLRLFARGASAIDRLRDGDRVLVAESCTHHREDDDIGRVKLPALVRKKSGAKVAFEFVSGHDFPENVHEFALVLHCGACMTNRRAVLSRQARAEAAGVAMTNYGMAIAHCLGMLDRALEPFGLRHG